MEQGIVNIGKVNKVILREIWKNEARDFTAWLSENLDTLGEVLEMQLVLIEKEKQVGSFFLDILAEGENGETVIIENQLEKTDHDHLGKMLTYLSNLDAKIAIWISPSPREEHKIAIDWLNQNSPDDIGFYLIRVEAIQINNSDAAPLFTIESEPTEMTKTVGKEKRDLAERHHKRREFWAQLLEKSKQRTKLFSNTSPKYDHWIGTGIGKTGVSLNLVITKDRGQVEIYIDRGAGHLELNKARYGKFVQYKNQIESTFGGPLKWERLDKKRASRISYRYENAGLSNEEQWPIIQDTLINQAIKLNDAIKPYIKELP